MFEVKKLLVDFCLIGFFGFSNDAARVGCIMWAPGRPIVHADDQINPVQSDLSQQDAIWPYLARLRPYPLRWTPEGDFAAH